MIKGKIYRIVNSVNDSVYIGSTQTSLRERFWHHRWDARNKNQKSKFYQFMYDIGVELFSMILIEEMDVYSRTELLQIEEYHINQFKTANPELSVNTIRAYATKENTRQRKHKDYLRYKATKKTLYYLKLLPFYDYD